jgi:hypothetical protein
MKTRRLYRYYFGILCNAAIVAGVIALATGAAYPASTDVIPEWMVLADTPLPGASEHGTTQAAQDSSAATDAVATGTAPADSSAADDAAALFTPRDCNSVNINGCNHHGGGSGSNGAASGGGSGASGNGAGGAGAGAGAGAGCGGAAGEASAAGASGAGAGAST